jgi:hypothetical protein
MTAQPATFNGGWTGFRAVNGDDAAANTAATDLIHILDTVEGNYSEVLWCTTRHLWSELHTYL